MRIADNGVDFMSAPTDYAELFQKYYRYVVILVRRCGIDDSRKEDVASDILLRFFERDFLNKFDPTMVFNHDGQDRPARFKSFLTKFVLVYLRGYKDKQFRQSSRELLLCDMPLTSTRLGWPGDSNSTWLEVFGTPEPGADTDVLADMDEQLLVDELRAYIKQVPRRSQFDTCDLLALFDSVIRQVREQGTWNVNELRAEFNVSATAMHSWLWWLRANLAAALGRPVPAKRPRTVKAKAV